MNQAAVSQYLPILTRCPLFDQISREDLSQLITQSDLTLRSFLRDQVVAFEEDECSSLGVVASGRIHIQRIYASGKLLTIETFHAGDSFGEALIFSDTSVYPATLTAQEETTVLYIPRQGIAMMCQRSPVFLANFLRTLSNRILLLNRKIKSLSFITVRQKVANFLLDELNRQKREELVLALSRQELADTLGIPRPSLSRELIAMKDDGWIDFDRRSIRVLDRPALEQVLLQ